MLAQLCGAATRLLTRGAYKGLGGRLWVAQILCQLLISVTLSHTFTMSNEPSSKESNTVQSNDRRVTISDLEASNVALSSFKSKYSKLLCC